jgi:DHA1 family bicyclomycin/chloramphenicol resistance-like MFS transporter
LPPAELLPPVRTGSPPSFTGTGTRVKRNPGQMVLLAACTSLGPLALNLYLPSVPEVQAQFGASVADVQATVSLPLVAFGLGLVLLGPLTDRFGRRPCLLGGVALFIAGSLLGALAPGLGLLAIARVLQSIGSALAFISSRAIVADLSPGEQLARSVAQMTMLILVVQSFAPMLGNLLIATGGWRMVQSFGVALALVLLGGVALKQRETLPRAQRAAPGGALDLLRPTGTVLVRPGFVVLLLQVGLLYSAYPAFLSIAPHLMVEAFGRPPTEFAYYFVMLPMGYFAGNAFVLRFGRRLGQEWLIPAGTTFALLACLLCMLLMALGLRHPLALFIPAGALLNFGLGLALPTVSARAVTRSSPQVGSGWGLVGCAQQVMAAVAVQVVGLFRTDSPWPLLLTCGAAMVLVLAFEAARGRWTAA